MSCENEFLVDDPYAELDAYEPDDTLVFNVECETRTPKAGSQIKTWGPEPEDIDYSEPHMQDMKALFPLLPWEL